MKNFMPIFSLLFIVSTAGAQTVKVSCRQGDFRMELIADNDANSFKLRTTRGNGYQELSQPMLCSLATSEGIFMSAECMQSILNIKFAKNASGFFSITHEMVIPGKPDLKDPMAGSYGDQFDCRGENQ